MAGVPIVPGGKDYTFEESAKYITVEFYKQFLENYYPSTCLTAICNRDFAEPIKAQGDTVYIRTYVDPTIKEYSKGAKIEYQSTESPSKLLRITEADYWALSLDDIDVKQMDLDLLDKLAKGAAKQIKIKQETTVFSTLYTKSGTANKGLTAGAVSASYNLGTTGSPVTVNKLNIIEKIGDCRSVLMEQNIGYEEETWMVAPEKFYNILMNSELKAAFFSGDSATSTYGNMGLRAKNIRGFNMHISNLIPAITDGNYTIYPIVFGQKYGLALADQLTKTDMIPKLQDTFASGMRGLFVWGWDVIKTESIGTLYCVIDDSR